MPAIWPVIFFLIIGMTAKVAPSAPCTNIEQRIVIPIATNNHQMPSKVGTTIRSPVSETPARICRYWPCRRSPGDTDHVDEHGPLAVPHGVGQQATQRASEEIHERKGGRDQTRQGGRHDVVAVRRPQVLEGRLEEHRQHRHHGQLGTEVGEVGTVECGHAAPVVSLPREVRLPEARAG